jgi:hypothetical protein
MLRHSNQLAASSLKGDLRTFTRLLSSKVAAVAPQGRCTAAMLRNGEGHAVSRDAADVAGKGISRRSKGAMENGMVGCVIG